METSQHERELVFKMEMVRAEAFLEIWTFHKHLSASVKKKANTEMDTGSKI